MKAMVIKMEIRHLTPEDHADLLNILNRAFGTTYGRIMDFVKEQPKIGLDDAESMYKHIGAYIDERLACVVGIYPMPAVVNGERLMFATTGNVATLPEFEGRGAFSKTFARAMEICEENGIDVARLSGNRQRYNRYGFDKGGFSYNCTFTAKNRQRVFPDFDPTDITFTRIERDDSTALKFAHDIYEKRDFYLERGTDNNYDGTYRTLCAKCCVPYLATDKSGRMIGYISASENGDHIWEIRAVTTENYIRMIPAWNYFAACDVRFNISPLLFDEAKFFTKVCEDVTVSSTTFFKIINWEKVTRVYLNLKAKYETLPDGELKIAIADYGTLEISVSGGVPSCVRTNGEGDISLDKLDATRLIFGHLPTDAVCSLPYFAKCWFPLPMTWDSLDAL